MAPRKVVCNAIGRARHAHADSHHACCTVPSTTAPCRARRPHTAATPRRTRALPTKLTCRSTRARAQHDFAREAHSATQWTATPDVAEAAACRRDQHPRRYQRNSVWTCKLARLLMTWKDRSSRNRLRFRMLMHWPAQPSILGPCRALRRRSLAHMQAEHVSHME